MILPLKINQTTILFPRLLNLKFPKPICFFVSQVLPFPLFFLSLKCSFSFLSLNSEFCCQTQPVLSLNQDFAAKHSHCQVLHVLRDCKLNPLKTPNRALQPLPSIAGPPSILRIRLKGVIFLLICFLSYLFTSSFSFQFYLFATTEWFFSLISYHPKKKGKDTFECGKEKFFLVSFY